MDICPDCYMYVCACNNPAYQLMIALEGGLSKPKPRPCTTKGLKDLPPMTVIGTMGTNYDWEVN